MRPQVILTIDGAPVSGLFMSRLIQVTVTDHEGGQGDAITVDLEAGPPFLAVPRKKALIQCWMGYAETGIEDMGQFEVNDVTLEIFPWKMKIHGKSADEKSSLKQHRDKHYDKKTLGDIYNTLAGRHGLEAQVAPSIASQTREYVAQVGESDIHFGERLARSVDGLFKIAEGKMIVAEKGSGNSPGGAAMPVVVLTPERILKHTTRIQWGERETHNKVKAHHHDRGKAKRQTEEAEADPDGESEYTLRHSHGSKEEAKAAAEAKAKDLGRNADSVAATIEGDPWVKAGSPLQFAIGHPDVDAQSFIIENASHTVSVQNRSYRTAIQARNPSKAPGKSGQFSGPRNIGGTPRGRN